MQSMEMVEQAVQQLMSMNSIESARAAVSLCKEKRLSMSPALLHLARCAVRLSAECLDALEAAARCDGKNPVVWEKLAAFHIENLSLSSAESALKASPVPNDEMLAFVRSLIKPAAESNCTTIFFDKHNRKFEAFVLSGEAAKAIQELNKMMMHTCQLRLSFLVPTLIECIGYFASRMAENGDNFAADILKDGESKALALISCNRWDEVQKMGEESILVQILFAKRQNRPLDFERLITQALSVPGPSALRADVFRIASESVFESDQKEFLLNSAKSESREIGDLMLGKGNLLLSPKCLSEAKRMHMTVLGCFKQLSSGMWRAKF